MTDRPRLAVVSDSPLHDITPPHDTDAERAILGACLTSRGAIDAASNHLTPSDFYDLRHETIYAAIEHRYARLETVDQVSICDDLRKQLPAWGGQAFIFDLVMAPGALEGNTERHAVIVARLAAKRRLLTTHLRGVQRALDYADTDTTPEQLLEAARDDLDKIPTGVPGAEGPPVSTWAPVELAGYAALTGETLPFVTVAVEVEPPHFVTVATYRERDLLAGHARMRAAVAEYQRRTESGVWIDPPEVEEIPVPDWYARTYRGEF